MKRLVLLYFFSLILSNLFAQFVNIDSIRINGSIPRMTYLRLIQESQVKIDSIVKVPELMDALDADSIVYIGKSYFSFYTKDKTCYANVIIFDNKINHISFGKNVITRTTIWNDLRDMFPIDCSYTKPVSIYGENEKYESCSLPVKDSKGRIWDMRIVFFFQNDRLVRIDFREPD